MFSFSQSLSFLDDSQIPWKNIIIGLTIGNFAFQRYLDYRQYNVLEKKSPPSTLKAEINQETFDKSQDYSRAKLRFGWITLTFSLAVELLEIKYNFLATSWAIGGWLVKKFAPVLPAFANGQITQSVFFFLTSLILKQVIDIPFDYYRNFVLEEKYGFNKMTIGVFFSDFFKTLAVSLIITGPFLAAFLKIIDYFGDQFVLYAAGLFIGFMVIIQTIYPVLIAPLFNKFEPLEDGELKTAIENLAKKENFPLTKLYKKDGSTRSAHSNAYFVGLPWSKQIVLYDTLIDQLTIPEIVAVLAHEIGHWQLWHIPKMMVYMNIQILFFLSLFNGFLKNKLLYEAFGFTTQPALVGFTLFSYLYQPILAITTFVTNLLSRKHEYEADAYGVARGYGHELATSLIKMTTENLLYVDADWLYSAFHRSHPLLLERLLALKYESTEKVGKGISPLKKEGDDDEDKQVKKD